MSTDVIPARGAPGAPLLEVDGLRITRARHGGCTGTIVSSVSMALRAGETIGIVGESGSGKSLTAKAIIGLLPPGLTAHGTVSYAGSNLLDLPEKQWRAIRGRQIAMILQDPFTMLNPVARCGQIIAESLPAGGPPGARPPGGPRTARAWRRAEVARRLAEVGITDGSVAERYPFQLSGGMRQRVAIAAALARGPRVLIADEPSTALDVATQRDILALIAQIQRAQGMGVILITHDLRVAFTMCERVYVLYAGSLVETARAADLREEPLHPYSHGLLLSEPPAGHRVRELAVIPGSVPSADQVGGSCAFAPRCRWAAPECRRETPALAEVGPGRLSACVRLPQIRAEMALARDQAARDEQPAAAGRTGTALITVRDVRKVFRQGSREVTALDGVSIDVGGDESVGIVGESGSGKTTLARLLIGLDHATSGQLTIGGVAAADWAALSGADRRRLRGTVQIVFQDPYSSLNPMHTVGWALAEAVTTHDRRARNVPGQVAGLLASVGLPSSYAGRKPFALSGGERQRVAIARALAARPRVLICDEPVSALDVSVQAQILNLLTALRADRGIGYLFITHDLSIVRQVTDYLYVMRRGRIVESGPTGQVLDHPRDPYTVNLIESVPGRQTEPSTSRE